MAVKELTSTQRTIALITVVALFIYAIVNAFLVIYAYAKLTKNVDQLEEYVNNWNSGVVLEVQAKATCDSGYEPMFTGRSWYGVNSGCYCGTGVSSANRDKYNITCSPFCSSSCPSTFTSSGCSSVTGRSAQDIEYWGAASTTAYKICVKRSKETWGSQAPLINSDGTCPAGYTTCGTTDEYKFCTKESKCPITSLTWASATSCGGANCIVVDNNVATGKTLSYTRSNDAGGDGLPLAEFRVNEYGMCDAKDTDDITPSRPNFGLLKTKISTCNNEGGSLWNANADITYEDRLFSLHGLTTYISTLAPYTTSTMTGYYKTGKSGSDYQWKLFNRESFPFKISCRDDMESLIDKMEALTNLKTAQTALLVIGLISTAVLGIALAYMEIQNLRGVDLSCIDGKGEEERQKLKKIKKYMTYVFKFLVIPFQIWAIALTGNTKGLFAKVGDNECSSADVNAVMSYFGATLKSSYKSNITAIALTVATLLVDILLALWDARKAKKEATKVATSPKEGNDKTQIINLENSSMNSPGKTPNVPLNQAPASQFASPGYPNSGGLTVQINAGGEVPQQTYAQQAFPQQQAYPQQQFAQPQAYPQQQFVQPQVYPQQQAYPQQQYPQQFAQQQYPQPVVQINQQESGVQERSNPFAKR